MSDELWLLIEPHIIGNKGTWGGNSKDTRKFINAVFWILRTGAPWRDLPSTYVDWKNANRRFCRWRDKNRPLAKLTDVGFARQFFARLGADAAANPCGSQEGSDEALRKIDRKDGVR